MANGDIRSIGAIYLNGGAVVKPVNSRDSSNIYGSSFDVTLGDGSNLTSQYIWDFIEFNIKGSTYYIAPTLLCRGVKGEDLAKAMNKELTVNGAKYKLCNLTSQEYTYLMSNSAFSMIDTKTAGMITSTKAGTTAYITRGGLSNDLEGSLDASVYDMDYGYLPCLRPLNNPPIISGYDEHLGTRNTTFELTYSVSDTDNGELSVVEKLNGSTIRTIQNPTKDSELTLSITSEMLKELTIGVTNTIEIQVSDGQATVYRRYTFIKTNSAPVISGEDRYLGTLTNRPADIKYSVYDIENETITVAEKINGITINSFTATPNQEYAISLNDEQWFSCLKEGNVITVEATDINGSSSIRTFKFDREVSKIQISTKNAIETSSMATKIMVTPQYSKTGCTVKIEVCNNGFDSSPTWENMTSMSNSNRPYMFTNETKTASKWGIKVRITVTKNNGYTGEVYLDGFGGAYE